MASDVVDVANPSQTPPRAVIGRWGKETMKSSIIPGALLTIPYLVTATTTVVGTVTGLGTNAFQEIVTVGGPSAFFALMGGVGAIRVKTAPAREARKARKKAVKLARKQQRQDAFRAEYEKQTNYYYQQFVSAEWKQKLHEHYLAAEEKYFRHEKHEMDSDGFGDDDYELSELDRELDEALAVEYLDWYYDDKEDYWHRHDNRY